MTNQLRRAAVSVTANIAEGNSRSTGKDKARYLVAIANILNYGITWLKFQRLRNYIVILPDNQPGFFRGFIR